jgi:hypothetical protein
VPHRSYSVEARERESAKGKSAKTKKARAHQWYPCIRGCMYGMHVCTSGDRMKKLIRMDIPGLEAA